MAVSVLNFLCTYCDAMSDVIVVTPGVGRKQVASTDTFHTPFE